MVSNATFSGISLIFVDWQVVKTGENIYNEIHQPILFFLLSFSFMLPYIKKLKEGKNKKS